MSDLNIAALGNPSQALDAVSNPSQQGSERVEQRALGQSDFFKLLTTQLASQDPLEPMDDTAFIAQMAQFSSLEMMNGLTKSFDRLANGFELQSSRSLVGQMVKVQDGSSEVSGFVERVSFDDREGAAKLFINGRGYDMATLSEVGSVSNDPDFSRYLSQVGQQVTFKENQGPRIATDESVEGEAPRFRGVAKLTGVQRINGQLVISVDNEPSLYSINTLLNSESSKPIESERG